MPKKNAPLSTEKQKEKQVLKKYKRNKTIGLFSFFALTASMVVELYEYPSFATSGWSLIMFLLLMGLCWFIPTAICAAEMATVKKWSEGGIFTWVSNLLGPQWGFAAVFFQWFETIVGFITMLYFVTTAFSYGVAGDAGFNLVNPTDIFGTESATYSVWALFGIVVLFLLVITGSQMFGIKYTAIIAKSGFILGILVPMFLLVGFGIAYIVAHGLENIGTGLFPPGEQAKPMDQLVICVSFMLSYMGIEASASHARDMKNPRKQYPIAIFTLVGITIVMSSLGAIMIAIALPSGSVSFSGGIIQAMLILTNGNVVLVRVMAILLCLGTVAEISGWVVGPAFGLAFAAKADVIPKKLGQVNRFEVPYFIIVIQTIMVIIFGAIITFGLGLAGSAFLSAMTLTVLIYLLAYILMFAAYFKLIIKNNDLERSFKLKYKWLQILMATSGMTMSVFALIICFFPQPVANFDYGLMLSILVPCFVVAAAAPFGFFWIYHLYKSKHPVESKTRVSIPQQK